MIWNLVFMHFVQVSKDQRIALPKPSFDTGMVLDRITSVMQGKHDNYDIDIMRTLIEASADFSHTDADGEHKMSHRVIADHLRSRSEEHTSELQSLMRISYAVFCLKKKKSMLKEEQKRNPESEEKQKYTTTQYDTHYITNIYTSQQTSD